MTHKIVQLEHKKERKICHLVKREVGSEFTFLLLRRRRRSCAIIIEVARMSKRERENFIIIFSFQIDKGTILLKENEREKGDSNGLLMSFYFVISEAEHIDVMREAKRRKRIKLYILHSKNDF